VLRGLRVADLAGPVLARGEDWLFLCAAVGDSRPELRTALVEDGVYVISRAAAVIVPTEPTTGWVRAPLPRCTPPPWQAILATARRNVSAPEWPHVAAA
jgi:hypothetical protein